jgi:cytochrome c oxidase assembly protein subunit 15
MTVDADTLSPGGSGSAATNNPERPLAIWLAVVAALVFAMVLLGGATRLTHSGLSMVEWKPLMGVLPPLSDADWQETFGKYQQSPEYKKINFGMSLAEFKRIFYFEYFHRILGRTIGLAFALPFLWFLFKRMIPRRRVPVLLGLFLLGGMQGLVGWWMVKSGLVDRPDVSHYRLAAHLGLAVVILGALVWVALDMWDSGKDAAMRATSPRWPAAAAVLLLTLLQILTGALVAGLDAGLVYNTFPMMGEYWLPPELADLSPWWLNILENPYTVQFDHRIGAYLLVIAVGWLSWSIRAIPGLERSLPFIIASLLVQFALGVATLLLQVPVVLGVLHQAGALVLFVALVHCLYRLRRLPLQKEAIG